MTGQGIESARSSLLTNQLAGFFAMESSNNRYQTGSSVNLNGFSLIAGFGKMSALQNGTMLNGLFLEYGDGNYSTHNSFDSGSIRGGGDTSYYGLGYLGRYQKTSGLYTEGSIRVGQTSNNFQSSDLNASIGQNASYKTSSFYYGMHLALGKEQEIGRDLALDTYTKVFWAHLNANSGTIAGDPVNFAAVDSYRWQLGMKLTHQVKEQVAVRAGLDYQYEFGGEAKDSASGYGIDTSSLKGSSYIGELGRTFDPQNGKYPFLDLNLQGYDGNCSGITGNLNAIWKF